MIKRLALILLLIAPSWAWAGSLTTQEVFDLYEKDNLYLGYVSGILKGLTIYGDVSQTTLGIALYCRDYTALSTNDFLAIIKGEIAKLNNAEKQKFLEASFQVAALIVMQRVYPCE